MTQALRALDWDDETEYLPAILTMIAMPFTFSIATGIGIGFIAYAAVKALTGRAGQVHGAVWLLAGLSAIKFALG
jgi:AGZA family xanthine/uracil permease-like MFS transporter